MKKINYLIGVVLLSLVFVSCKTTLTTVNNSVVPLPPLTLNRSDYKITKDLSASVDAKVTTLFGVFKFAKIIGEDKNVAKVGYLKGYETSTPSVNLALYKIFEQNPDIDYFINVRVKESYTLKNFLIVKVLNTNTTVYTKGIKIK